MRKLGGDRAAAQDVAQEVFTLLARKAHRLGSVVLAGWLYRQTCRRAANHVRSETRRRSRETAAATMNSSTPAAPPDAQLLARELDDAMLTLPADDRDALVLRYFEGHGYRSIGEALGLGEEAARKRVQRAVKKLGTTLKRKGIAAGVVSLGTALDGFGAPPIPAEMVSRLTTTALKTSAAPVALSTLLNPALAGVLATSLISGSVFALRQPATPPHPVVTNRVSPRDARTGQRSDNLPQDPTLDQIIAEIRRIRSSPQTVLSELRLKVALAKIQVLQTPEFILRSKDILNAAERQKVYQKLLERWWEGSPDATLTFMLEKEIGPLIRGGGQNYLLGELFRRWTERDRVASEAWLLRNWNEATLAESYGEGSYRNFLSMWISGEYFSKGDIDGVFAFASRMPTMDDQARSISQIVGMVPMHSRWRYSDGSKSLWLKFYRRLETFPDEEWREQFIRSFWKTMNESNPDGISQIRGFLQPEDPFSVMLGLLAVKGFDGQADQNGSIKSHEIPVQNREDRIAAAMEAGIAAGMDRREVMSAIGRAMVDGTKEEEYFSWLETHRDEIELDDYFSKKARSTGVYGSITGRKPDAIRWGSLIADPELRRRTCRAAFRRFLAGCPGFAMEYINEGRAPSDLADDFQAIATSQP